MGSLGVAVAISMGRLDIGASASPVQFTLWPLGPFPLLCGWFSLRIHGSTTGMIETVRDAQRRDQLFRERMLIVGLPGTTTIVAFEDTGSTFNDDPLVDVTLDVDLDGRERYRARRSIPVSRLKVGLLTTGRPIPVRVDPANRDAIIIRL